MLARMPRVLKKTSLAMKSRCVSTRLLLTTWALMPFFAMKAASIPMIRDLPSPVPTRASIVLNASLWPLPGPAPHALIANMSSVIICVWWGIIITLYFAFMALAAAPPMSMIFCQSAGPKVHPRHAVCWSGAEGLLDFMTSLMSMSGVIVPALVAASGCVYIFFTHPTSSMSCSLFLHSASYLLYASWRSSLPMYSRMKITVSRDRKEAIHICGACMRMESRTL
mmetsp:Transcript_126849/g.358924  ORF Transcript_126849/g.358924 Transcript_126849/m.358924 type:complete len:224 (+) Transcript_126849:578-1249(+)